MTAPEGTANGSEAPKIPAREVRPLLRRHYRAVTVDGCTHAGFRILLDGKTLRTPAKAVLVLPTRALAEAVAAEWAAQSEHIDPSTMPLTRLVNSAIDGVRGREAEVRNAIAKYAESDLLCYRAETPEELVARQMYAWQPWLDWAASAYDAPLRVGSGIGYVRQHRGSVAALRGAVAALDVAALAALGVAVPALGSLVLGLAMAAGRLDAAAAHALGALDELFQVEAWGEDAEAAARRAAIAADVHLAARFLQLTRPAVSA